MTAPNDTRPGDLLFSQVADLIKKHLRLGQGDVAWDGLAALAGGLQVSPILVHEAFRDIWPAQYDPEFIDGHVTLGAGRWKAKGARPIWASLVASIRQLQELTPVFEGLSGWRPVFPAFPRPIPRLIEPSVPALPPEVLPEPIATVAEDLRRRLCVDSGFFAIPALCAAGALIGGRIRIRGASGFHLGANLWGLVSAPSGMMKSGPAGLAMRPLQRLEDQWLQEHQSALETHARLELAWDGQKKQLKKALDHAGDPDQAREIADQITDGEPKPPLRRRVLIADSTPEKTAILLVENQNGLLCYVDEFAQHLDAGAKKGREDQRALDLASYEPSGAFQVDRVGRPSLVVREPRLSLCGTIQPEVLRRMIEGRQDGYFERFIIWEPLIPPFFENSDPRDDPAEQAYSRAVSRLAHLDPEECGAQYHEAGGFHYLRLDQDAKKLYRHWLNFIEKLVRKPSLQSSPRFASWFGKTRSLILKLALITHLLEGNTVPISCHTLARSMMLCLVLLQHAARALAPCRVAQKPVTLLADLLIKEQTKVFQTREITERDLTGLSKINAEGAVKELVEMGWLVEENVTTGGRPTYRYHVNNCLNSNAFAGFAGALFQNDLQNTYLEEVHSKHSVDGTLCGLNCEYIYNSIGHSINIYTNINNEKTQQNLENPEISIQPAFSKNEPAKPAKGTGNKVDESGTEPEESWRTTPEGWEE